MLFRISFFEGTAEKIAQQKLFMFHEVSFNKKKLLFFFF